MTKKEIERIKKEKRWSFNIWDIFEKYFIVIFPLGLVLVSFSATSSGFTNNINNLKIGGLISLFFSFYVLIFIIKKLYKNQIFESYKVNDLTIEKIRTALINIGFDNFKYYKSGYFEINTNISWFSWGETVIIIPLDNDIILINIKPSGQPITIGRDKKNIQKIINELNRI